MLRKSVENNIETNTLTNAHDLLNNNEIEIIKIIKEYPNVLENAANNHSPALVANYIFELAKEFNRFYQENPIFKEENESLRIIRLQLSQVCAEIIKQGMRLLGIDVPERM